MIPDYVASYFAANQEALWVTTLLLDLAGTVLLYRMFGKVGLQVAIDTVFIYWAKHAFSARHPAEPTPA